MTTFRNPVNFTKSFYQYYPWFILFYFLTMALLRIIIDGGLERDEAEQILLHGQIAWGYGPQPPLYTWLQNIFFKVFGANIAALALLKNLLLFGIYFFAYRTGTLLTNSKTLGVIASVMIFFIPTISWRCQRDLTHTVLLIFMVSVTFYILTWMKKNVKRVDSIHYMLLGVIFGLGLLSKYNYALVLLAIFITVLMDKDLKKILLDKRVLLTVGLMLLLISPHLIWMSEHIREVYGGTLGKSNASFSLNPFHSLSALLKSFISMATPLLIAFFVIFRNTPKKPPSSFIRNYLIAITLILFALTFLNIDYRPRWIVPLYLPLTLYLADTLNGDYLSFPPLKRLFILISLIALVIVSIYTLRVYYPHYAKRFPRFVYPYSKIAELFKSNYKNIDTIFYFDHHIGGNLRLHYPKIPIEKFTFSRYKSARENNKTVLLVWDEYKLPGNRYKEITKSPNMLKVDYLHTGDTGKYLFTVFWKYFPSDQ